MNLERKRCTPYKIADILGLKTDSGKTTTKDPVVNEEKSSCQSIGYISPSHSTYGDSSPKDLSPKDLSLKDHSTSPSYHDRYSSSNEIASGGKQ